MVATLAARGLLASAFLVASAAIAGCAPNDPCAGREDMLLGDEGLEVTEEEHAAGWGREDCLACHALAATHRVACVEVVELDLAEIRAEASDGRYDTCADCHGDNGVSED